MCVTFIFVIKYLKKISETLKGERLITKIHVINIIILFYFTEILKILKVNTDMSWRNVWEKWQILQQREPRSLLSFQ